MNVFSKFLQCVRYKPPMPHPYEALSNIPLSDCYEDTESGGLSLSPIDDEDPSSTTEYKDEPTSTYPSSTLDGLTSSKAPQPNIFYRLLTVLRRTLIYLLPSFIPRHWAFKNPTHPPKPLPTTTSLNNVRGLASFFVWCQHFLTEYFRG
jgi:hypothetical protein